MSSTNPAYYTYRPTKLKVSHLGVNISNEKNNTLALSNEYLIVGEHYTNTGGQVNNTYSLVVDQEGIATNISLPTRQANNDNYPNHMQGTLYVDGNIIVSGVVTGNTDNIIGGTSNFWRYSSNNNIYYDGKMTVGSYDDSSNNSYSLNISESANKDINRAQISIQNRQLSQMRVAILGALSNSPIIFNTPEQTPMEFHVGRKEAYFNTVYAGANPAYVNSNDAPQLNIDINGNVGIHTNFNHKLNYQIYKPEPGVTGSTIIENNYESMNLHVEGPLYARNVLVYDYNTSAPKNLDQLFLRSDLASIYASNVLPGSFPTGFYHFRSNVRILQTNDNGYALDVGGDVRVASNLYVDTYARFHAFGGGSSLVMEAHGLARFHSNVEVLGNLDVYGTTHHHGNVINDSDIRIKENLKPIEKALDKIKQLTGYTYDKLPHHTRETGLIAQDVEKVLPELVAEGKDGILGIAYGNMMGLIVEGIKELSVEIEEIKRNYLLKE